MFVVVIPTWDDADCWRSLRNSEQCRHHLLLPAGEHGYCEGAQHNRCGFHDHFKLQLPLSSRAAPACASH